MQTIFSRLYKVGSSCQEGTLLQLRNLINRRNVRGDTSGRFNETIDFFQLVVECHILAAAMHFFSMQSLDDVPSTNALPDMDRKKSDEKWAILKERITELVNRYVLVDKVANINSLSKSGDQTPAHAAHHQQLNPHATRIAAEHCYTLSHHVDAGSSSTNAEKPKRQFPSSFRKIADEEVTPYEVQKYSPDGVFNYASAVLNDGLLLLELRDAIHEGDGPRIIRCWKFMLLHWRHAGHTKYAHVVIQLVSAIQATAPPRIAHELVWCRIVNTRGGAGNNIPADLYFEHLNRTLKDYLNGIGPNISSNAIVQTSKSLRCLLDVTANFDRICNIGQTSIHHTIALHQRRTETRSSLNSLLNLECLTIFPAASTTHSRESSLTFHHT